MLSSESIHYLYPGGISASKQPLQINTILGSCVSVCLFDPILNIGGMNHFMLPVWNGLGLPSPKYGNIAIEKLIEKLLSYGSKKHCLKAKIFGGSEIITPKKSMFNIGERNIEVARQLLDEQKIPILSSSVGGQKGRKIRFYSFNGEVSLSFIASSNINNNY